MGISRSVAFKLVKRKGFPAIHVGEKRLCVPKDKFIEWINTEAEKPIDN
jgi:predicted DNA-binding transcriptional regulator AlpA